MKWLFVLACALTLRDSVAIFGAIKNALGFGEKTTEQFYNLHCKLENVNELVCFVDVLNYEAKEKDLYEKDGASFCGAFKFEQSGERVTLSSYETPEEVSCTTSRACRAVNQKGLVSAVYGRHKEVCAKDGEKSSEQQSVTVYTARYETQDADDIKITTDMLSNAGFVSVKLGKAPIDEPRKQKSDDTKTYFSISGGGWRALSSSVGVLRGLSVTGALANVDMFTSVSGASWFLSKLAFDNEFASEVLGTEVPIGHVITKWYETDYYPGITASETKPCTNEVGKFLSSLSGEQSSISPAMIVDMVGDFERFDYDWGRLVHEFIVGDKTSKLSLHTATISDSLRTKIPKQVKFAFNWNHFNHWGGDDVKQFFLREKKTGKISQRPVYTNAHYDLDGDDFKVEVKARGSPIKELFEVCNVGDNGEHVCGDHDFSKLTVGQAASASSAYMGFTTVRPWMKAAFTQIRSTVPIPTEGLTGTLACKAARPFLGLFLKGHCNRAVQAEIGKITGCRDETIDETTNRYTRFLRNMAIDFTRAVKGETDTSKMAFDALNDINGVSTIISEHLKGGKAGQALVIVNNGLGSNYMEKYFQDGPHFTLEDTGCEPDMPSDKVHEAYQQIEKDHAEFFKKNFGVEFKRNEKLPICSAPMADTSFFAGAPPQQYRFEDPYVPKHITYAYKKSAKIIRNDEFYALKDGQESEMDVLFLILNAPLATFAHPKEASIGHVGVAGGMEAAVNALQKLFPSFFP